MLLVSISNVNSVNRPMSKSNTSSSIVSSMILVFNGVFEKTIGLISTMILARVLVPEDFGIVATTSLIMIFIRVFGLTGFDIYFLSRETKISTLLSGWTFELKFRIILFILLNFLAYPISVLLSQPEVWGAIHFLSFTLIILGLKNPWIYYLEKGQNYKVRLKIVLVSKIISITISVTLALILESYWALLIGTMVSNLSETLCSYIFVSQRPMMVKRTKKHFKFFVKQRIWVNFVGNLKQNFDMYFVVYMFDIATVGKFHVMKFLATIPSMSIFTPLAAPLLQEMSKNSKDKEDFFYKFIVSYIYIAALIIPFTYFCIVNSQSIIVSVFGQKWVTSHVFFQILIVYTFIQFINTNSLRILTIKNEFSLISVFETISAIAMIAIFLFFRHSELATILTYKVAVDMLLSMLLMSLTLYKVFPLRDIWVFLSMNIKLMIALSGSAIAYHFLATNHFAIEIFNLFTNTLTFAAVTIISISAFYLFILKGTQFAWFIDNKIKHIKTQFLGDKLC